MKIESEAVCENFCFLNHLSTGWQFILNEQRKQDMNLQPLGYSLRFTNLKPSSHMLANINLVESKMITFV